jgi:hypothetical protein
MAEPLTNVILDSNLHFIRQDLTRNRGAPPCWAPPRWAPAHRHHHCHCWSGPRTVCLTPSYRPMEPSPPSPLLPPFGIPYTPTSSASLGCLAGPLKGITPFTVAGPGSALATEGESGSPAVKPLVWHTTDLMIGDQLGTPYTWTNPSSPTPDTGNPTWKPFHLPCNPVTPSSQTQ